MNDEIYIKNSNLTFKQIANHCDIQQIALTINSSDASVTVEGWADEQIVPLNGANNVIGNNLLLNSSSHCVVVGDNINYVEVSGFLQTVSMKSGSLFVGICVNDYRYIEEIITKKGIDWDGISIPSIIIPVSKGDKITMTICGDTGTYTLRRGQTRLIVKKVG